jgi:hypothetical protein
MDWLADAVKMATGEIPHHVPIGNLGKLCCPRYRRAGRVNMPAIWRVARAGMAVQIIVRIVFLPLLYRHDALGVSYWRGMRDVFDDTSSSMWAILNSLPAMLSRCPLMLCRQPITSVQYEPARSAHAGLITLSPSLAHSPRAMAASKIFVVLSIVYVPSSGEPISLHTVARRRRRRPRSAGMIFRRSWFPLGKNTVAGSVPN